MLKRPIESFIANLIQNTFAKDKYLWIEKKSMDYLIDGLMLNCTNMKEQERRIKEIWILLKILIYIGVFDWNEEEKSGNYLQMFPYLYNLYNLE